MNRNYFIILTLFILASCAGNSYQEKGDGWYGYYDKEYAKENVYYIKYYAGPSTQRKEIIAFWYKRAGELCGGNDMYDVFTEWPLIGNTIQKLDPSLIEDDDIVASSTKSPVLDKDNKEIQEKIDEAVTATIYGSDRIPKIHGYVKCLEK